MGYGHYEPEDKFDVYPFPIPYLVLEECHKFPKFIKSISESPNEKYEEVIFKVGKKLCRALKTIHVFKLAHLDISPVNIVLIERKGMIKNFSLDYETFLQEKFEIGLIDFGNTLNFDHKGTSTMFNSVQTVHNIAFHPIYSSPELAKKEMNKKINAYKSDIYSLGIILLELSARTDSKALKQMEV